MRELVEHKRLVEISDRIDPRLGNLVRIETLAEVRVRDGSIPILGWVIGTPDRSKPTLGVFGGVHGLERVGSHVILAYLEYLLGRLVWDRQLRDLLARDARIVSIPIVNPGGMLLRWRSNPRGVDLMRNAPGPDAPGAFPLVGGHRIGPWLPWYRGKAEEPLELESRTLCEFVRKEMFGSVAAVAMDLHSGFGMQDQLWYPYARSNEPFPDSARVERIKGLFDRTHTHHVYRIEPQSDVYTISGDLWDHLYDESRKHHGESGVFIPWTLEMGSWQWLRKNPSQVFRPFGLYDPILPHRYKRVMRRHLPMLDFFFQAAVNWEAWA